jgi:hypothetical protein
MSVEPTTIEKLISAWYSTGIESDECRLEVERVAKEVAARHARTRKPYLAAQIVDGAPAHIYEQLKTRLHSEHGDGRYDPSRPFRAWCSIVLKRFAVDCDRQDSRKRQKLLSPKDGEDGDPLASIPDRAQPVKMSSSDRNVVAASVLAEFVRAVPCTRDRIIVAVNTGYIDGLADDIVVEWLEDVEVNLTVAELRSINDDVGVLKVLAEILGMSHDYVRACSSRAIKKLKAANFQRALEAFE